MATASTVGKTVTKVRCVQGEQTDGMKKEEAGEGEKKREQTSGGNPHDI